MMGQVNLLRSVNHGNLVRLLGYCEDQKKVLIYEFAEEGTLWDHLHGQDYLWRKEIESQKSTVCFLHKRLKGCFVSFLIELCTSTSWFLTGHMKCRRKISP